MDGILQVLCAPGTCLREQTGQIAAEGSGLEENVTNNFKSLLFNSAI